MAKIFNQPSFVDRVISMSASTTYDRTHDTALYVDALHRGAPVPPEKDIYAANAEIFNHVAMMSFAEGRKIIRDDLTKEGSYPEFDDCPKTGSSQTCSAIREQGEDFSDLAIQRFKLLYDGIREFYPVLPAKGKKPTS